MRYISVLLFSLILAACQTTTADPEVENSPLGRELVRYLVELGKAEIVAEYRKKSPPPTQEQIESEIEVAIQRREEIASDTFSRKELKKLIAFVEQPIFREYLRVGLAAGAADPPADLRENSPL